MLSKLNYNVLSDIYGSSFSYFGLTAKKKQGICSFFNAFRGYIDGVDTSSKNDILENIRIHKYEHVFIDGSNLGTIAAVIKRHYPSVIITTFFHNVESRFFLGSLLQQKSIHALGVLLANFIAERLAVIHSDKIICLNNRDSDSLKRVYGRSATHIAPMVLEDQVTDSHFENFKTPGTYALFVGSTFYANRSGIEWFVREVCPQISIPLYIVGRGFEALKEQLETPGKVIVIGEVDSIAQWYKDALFVVAPIFDGSGMKTKVAEALMFGKKIVGTSEAFTGYEDIISNAGWVCESVTEFVNVINEATASIQNSYHSDLRQIYLDRFSYESARIRYKDILL